MQMERIPRVIRFLSELDCDSNRTVLPSKFTSRYGDQVPTDVKLRFPNGQEFDVSYNNSLGCLYRLGSMYREFGCYTSNCIMFCYKGDGNFVVHLMKHGQSEIEYSVPETTPQAPFIPEGERGWKFFCRGIGDVLKNGSTYVPEEFRKRFTLPKRLKVFISSGEVYDCFYLKKEKKIHGLLPVVKKRYLKLWDIFIFTYRGNGRLELAIFEKGVEKLFQPDPVPVVPEAMFIAESPRSSDLLLLPEPDNNQQHVMDYEEENDMGIQFSVSLKKSHVDRSSHGVYIPSSISPNNREWRVGEELVLTTDKGAWTVGLVRSGINMRISAGWNRFVKENGMKLNDTLVFLLAKDDEEGIIFHVEVE